jgi:hypothetical protein
LPYFSLLREDILLYYCSSFYEGVNHSDSFEPGAIPTITGSRVQIALFNIFLVMYRSRRTCLGENKDEGEEGWIAYGNLKDIDSISGLYAVLDRGMPEGGTYTDSQSKM